MNKVVIWSEHSDVMDCWVWRYGIQNTAGKRTPVGTSPKWADALTAAELLLYAQHHAQPRPRNQLVAA